MLLNQTTNQFLFVLNLVTSRCLWVDFFDVIVVNSVGWTTHRFFMFSGPSLNALRCLRTRQSRLHKISNDFVSLILLQTKNFKQYYRQSQQTNFWAFEGNSSSFYRFKVAYLAPFVKIYNIYNCFMDWKTHESIFNGWWTRTI